MGGATALSHPIAIFDPADSHSGILAGNLSAPADSHSGILAGTLSTPAEQPLRHLGGHTFDPGRAAAHTSWRAHFVFQNTLHAPAPLE
jgi:hypothetical protein